MFLENFEKHPNKSNFFLPSPRKILPKLQAFNSRVMQCKHKTRTTIDTVKPTNAKRTHENQRECFTKQSIEQQSPTKKEKEKKKKQHDIYKLYNFPVQFRRVTM